MFLLDESLGITIINRFNSHKGRDFNHLRDFAGVAQLVERNLAKVDVAGSNPVSRSVASNM